MARRARSVSTTIFFAASVAVGLSWSWCGRPVVAQQQTGDVATITGFSIPEVDDQGVLKWKVLGDFATFNPHGGPVDITRVRMEMYKDAQADMVLTSPKCLYDRERREAQTDAPVQITGKNLFITGTGFFWSGTNNLLVIRRDARVVVTNAKTFAKPATNAVIKTESSKETGK